jgi:hypothetical protein
MTYQISGKGRSWTCRVDGSRAVGWGSRPDLAIRNWHYQHRLLRKRQGSTTY